MLLKVIHGTIRSMKRKQNSNIAASGLLLLALSLPLSAQDKAAAKPIDMAGWSIISGVKSVAVKSAAGKPVVVQPDSYAVLAATSSKLSNNGVPALWGWNDAAASGFTIEDKASVPITLLNTSGQSVDTVTLNGPWSKGASMMLKETCLSTALNDKATCWVAATEACPYGKIVGKTGLSSSCKGTACSVKKDCKKPSQVCVVIQPDFEGGAIICEKTNGNPVNNAGTCVTHERGTPAAKNICK